MTEVDCVIGEWQLAQGRPELRIEERDHRERLSLRDEIGESEVERGMKRTAE